MFGATCFFFMPDTPATARFLDDEEKDWALRRMRLDAHGATNVDVDEEKFDWYWVKMALKAPQTYFNGFIWFFLLVSVLCCFENPLTHTDLMADPALLFLSLPPVHYRRHGLPLHDRTAAHRST